MNAVVGELITAGSTNATQLKLTDASQNENVPHKIKIVAVTSGGVKFGIGAVAAGAHAWVANDTLTITCKAGDLYFTSGHANNTFVVTV